MQHVAMSLSLELEFERECKAKPIKPIKPIVHALCYIQIVHASIVPVHLHLWMNAYNLRFVIFCFI